MESYMKFITMLLMSSNYKIQQTKIINSTTDVCILCNIYDSMYLLGWYNPL